VLQDLVAGLVGLADLAGEEELAEEAEEARLLEERLETLQEHRAETLMGKLVRIQPENLVEITRKKLEGNLLLINIIIINLVRNLMRGMTGHLERILLKKGNSTGMVEFERYNFY
jgi:hypothetical protein